MDLQREFNAICSRVIIILFLCIINVAMNVSYAWEADRTYKLTVLHTNDHHGRFWQNKYGEYGMSARKTLIDQIREEVAKEGGSVLLFSGGDINTGVPESDMQHAEPDFKGMNKLGYDAMAVGNHEFDNSLDILFKQQKWANFPMLSANTYYKDSNTRLFPAYHMFDKQGIKIAVIGLTTKDTEYLANISITKDLEFRDPQIEAKQVITQLKKNEKPDLIFAVTHMGHDEDGKHGRASPGDVSLARFLDYGELDMIVGGHSQEPVCMESQNVINAAYKAGEKCVPDFQNGTYIVQAHEWGKYVGRADYEFKNGKLTLINYQLIPINLKHRDNDQQVSNNFITNEIAEDPQMLEFLRPYQLKFQDKLNEVIGHVDQYVDFGNCEQTTMGKIVGQSHIEYTKADFAILNSGGLRSFLSKGNVTYRDLLTVQPFDHILSYVEMTGADLIDYLTAISHIDRCAGGYPQFAGISMKMAVGKVWDIKINDKPLIKDKVYRFSLPHYLIIGGDAYPNIEYRKNYTITGIKDIDITRNFFLKHSPIKVSDYEPKGEIVRY